MYLTKIRRPFFKLILAGLLATIALLLYLDARITATFTDMMWEVPAKVYARPLELFVGEELAATDLAFELELLGYRDVSQSSRLARSTGGRGILKFTLEDSASPANESPHAG